MVKMSLYFFTAAFLCVGTGMLLNFWHLVRKQDRAWRYANLVVGLGAAFLTLSLLFRSIVAGRGPFSNQYEFALAFAWGTVAAYLYLERAFKTRSLGVFVLPVALALMGYATTVPSDIEPLVPALQNNLLLTLHVSVAIVAYGTAAVAFASAVMYLAQWRGPVKWLPQREALESVGYRGVAIGFPMMVLVLVLGALWAHTAWGRYWGWDPKETATLVTALIYAGYLHAYSLKGWRGNRAALLLVLGFVATLFTFFGNLFFGGLHSYGGV
ncbi:MAG: c-type cytochrome biogenesis protein CcsB [Chloroflexi bacterium]|nr:c-type cytochrome biogenesis protein CcsB [Chloroflexota bacterium]